MRKSRKAKLMFQLLYNKCRWNGHEYVNVDKSSLQQRCKLCDYCPKQDGKKKGSKIKVGVKHERDRKS